MSGPIFDNQARPNAILFQLVNLRDGERCAVH